VEILQNLDEGLLKTGNLEPVLDAADEPQGADFWTDVLEQPADERCWY
jgi:hypothetical protein